MDTQAIRQMINEYVAKADEIMDGGENYDGVDGARNVLFVCGVAIELLNEIDSLELCIQDIMSEMEQ